MSTQEQRKRYKAYFERGVLGYMPEDLLNLRCGARTRAGTPCKLKDIFNNGRCKFHGGMSTGPKTKEGKQKVSMNLPVVRQHHQNKPHG